MNLEKRLFGKTDMNVTQLGFGAMELRLAENRPRAGEILGAVLDNGVNFIDTSQDYGESEELIGKHISHMRNKYYIATKCGCNLSGVGENHIFTSEHIIKNLEDSLRKLRTDYVDFWQLHCVTPQDLTGGADGEVVRAMLDMKRAGKARYIGVSFRGGKAGDEFYPIGHQERYLAEMAEWGCFDGFQVTYGALTRGSEGKIADIHKRGLGVVARGVLRKFDGRQSDRLKEAKLYELFGDGETESGFLLRFALSADFIGTMIIGSGNPLHIRANAEAAARGALPADVYNEAKRRLTA
jgi:aryl-alcohol dehydrogenase-like predicted oxidoreductase